ncbi:MAG: 30S ribosomal protein S9 [Lacunisphaera sp.]
MSAETSVYSGTGRRKTSTARVRLIAGTGNLSVNDRKFETYFTHDNFVRRAIAPLVTADSKDKFDVLVNVAGGGISSQSGAVAHGIARALLKFNPELRVTLKKAGHLTRDPREKERKKPGQPGARKRFQFSKR